ncbi:MAG: hypothetical protein L0216_05135 [Planctomycetales bacterium]|nr:hypothetical protein [Planctomycetales bacterium]
MGPGRKAGGPGGPSTFPPLARTLVPLLLAVVVVAAFAKSFLFRGSQAGKGPAAEAPPAPPLPGQLRDPQVTLVEDPGEEEEPAAPGPGAPAPGAPGAPLPLAQVPPFKEDPAILEAVEDDTGILERDALMHLMWKAVTTPAETVHAEARDVSHPKMRDAPKTVRGQAVRVRGRLYYLQPETDPWSADPAVNPSGVSQPYWGMIADPGFRTVQFYTPDYPPGLEVRDVVEIEGYFVKVWKFESATGATTRAPVMIVKTIRRIESRNEDKRGMTWVGWVVLGFLVISVPVFVVYLRRERARYLTFRQEQMKRRREEFQGATASPGPGATGAPPADATPTPAPPPPTGS